MLSIIVLLHNLYNITTTKLLSKALQRKHEGLERELAALDDRIHQMDQQAANLSEQHPEQKNKITSKQTEINQAWNDVVEKSKLRKRTLSDSLDLYRFLANYDVIKRWITSLQQQLDSIDITKDISSTEALLHRHQVSFIFIFFQLFIIVKLAV